MRKWGAYPGIDPKTISKGKMMQPVILDVDMGVDGALALMLALHSPEIDMMGISTVSGKVPVEIGVRSVLQILELLDRSEIPVFVGGESPLQEESIFAQEVDAPNGLEEMMLPESEMLPAGESVEFLVEGINSRPGEVILIALGPLTNLALAEERHPGILKQARRVFVMGGMLQGEGNVLQTVKYNYLTDPHAIRQVFQSGANVTLIPFDIAQQAGLDAEVIKERLEQRTDPIANFVRESSHTVIAYDEEHYSYSGIYLHAPLVMTMVFEPSLCSLEALWVDIEPAGEFAAGQVVVDEGKMGYQMECAVKVDAGRFLETFIHRVLGDK